MQDFSLKHRVTVHYTGSFEDGEGYQQLARVMRVADDGDTLFDFNHPMAGHTLTFELSLVSREPYTDEEA